MRSVWFPDRRLQTSSAFISDTFQTDFEKQAKLYDRLNLSYMQLTAGKFEGRLLLSAMDEISIHVEYCNQTMEKQISVSPDDVFFCILLDQPDAPTATDGQDSLDWVYVIPPSGGTVVVSPKDSIYLVIAVNREELIHSDGMIEEAAEWILNLDKRGAMVKSRCLTERLRSNVMDALEVIGQVDSKKSQSIIGQSIIVSIAYALTIECLQEGSFSVFERTLAFDRFYRARRLLLEELVAETNRKASGLPTNLLNSIGSKRSLEKAFSERVSMGPVSYSRVIRLHNVRRKLTAEEWKAYSIGDIAAQEGFLEWSRFSNYYHKQFGELPSATRKRFSV